jgi:hypothetical protein
MQNYGLSNLGTQGKRLMENMQLHICFGENGKIWEMKIDKCILLNAGFHTCGLGDSRELMDYMYLFIHIFKKLPSIKW